MPSQKPRILIPGGAGYIGSHVALVTLLTRKYRVTVLDNYHNAFPTAVKRLEQIAIDELPEGASQQDKDDCKVDVFNGDLRSKDDIRKVFESYQGDDKIWGVILCAALKAVGESSEIPIDYYDVNVGGLVNLLKVMHDNGCDRLVYSSSATVYGTPPKVPIPESTRLAPESVYGRTKWMSEIIIRDVCDAYPQFRAIGLRYFNPAGAHKSGKIGEDPRGKPGNLLPLLAQMAVGKYREGGLKVFGNDYPTPDGTCVRDYIHIEDLAGGHVNAVEALDRDEIFAEDKIETKGKYRAFNLGKGVGMSVLNMVDAMKKVSGYEFPHSIVGRRTGDVPDLTADPSLAEKELGFKATRTLDDMAQDLWRWQSNNPKGYGEQ
ncbi:related to GAL10-UDP-glucose 4-epimerase [Sporisorium reilianum f. sp. reilianum]|uniref:UDP-glucose 4-epimerase n=1 Tax=Sporisorium reilianum f. sp. reilianum TaxID=72559 RepID=A0A2N8UNI1_9BASI|nr:related to GAL10-UDP-glucose 4-epimerase [Sporisorium reilianum f. sp. reilianum]